MSKEYKLLLIQVLYHYLHEKREGLPKSDSLLVHKNELIKEYYSKKSIERNPYISTDIPIVDLCELLLEKLTKNIE